MQKIYTCLYRLVISLMLVISLVLAYLIYNQIPYYQLNITSSLMTIKNWIPFDFIENKLIAVNNNLNYTLVKENQYRNNTNQVISVCDGIILSSTHNQVVVLSDNGLKVYYDNLTLVNVYPQERVNKGVVLGVYEDYIELYAYDNELKVSYEDFSF